MKKIKLLLILFPFLLINFLGSKSWGFCEEGEVHCIEEKNCTNLDIRDQMTEEMKEFFSSPRHQGSRGWCYAFSVADVLSAYLGEPVSAFHVATLFNKSLIFSNPVTIHEGGNSLRTFYSIFKSGKICKESELPFDLTNVALQLGEITFGGRTLSSYGSLISDYDKIRFSYAQKTAFKDRDHKLDWENAVGDINRSLQKLYESNEDYTELARLIMKGNINSYLADFLGQACNKPLEVYANEVELEYHSSSVKKRIRTRTLSTFDIFKLDKAQMISTETLIKLQESLEKGIPVSYAYNTTNFKFPRDGGQHESVIVARRWHNNQCEFKIRNSYGKFCYSGGIEECVKEEGSFWISDRTMYEAATSFIFLRSSL